MAQPPLVENCKMRTGQLVKCSDEPALSFQGSEDTVKPIKPHFKRQLDRLSMHDCDDDSQAKKRKAVVTTLPMEVGRAISIIGQQTFDSPLSDRIWI
jgi:hypothetical protein